jgi:hypothetical protein
MRSLPVNWRLASWVVIGLLAASLLVGELVPGTGVGLAPGPVAAQSAAPYHWARHHTPFRLRVGDNVGGEWNGYLRAALEAWNGNETITLLAVEGSTDPEACAPVAGTVQVCDGWYGTQTGWLGLTRIYFNQSGDHIDAATVQLNNAFLFAAQSRYNSDAARRHTICHELGHTLGLDHPETSSCMNDSQHAIFTNVAPLDDDFRQLRRIYEHADATRTVARAGELAGFGPAGLAPESGEEVMALPLDAETAVLSFVTWADAASLADDGLAEAGLADDGLADAGQADAGLTDTGQAEASLPAGDLAEAGLTDAGLADPGLADPGLADRDGDQVADADEVTRYQTDPTRADSDGDGVLDGVELFATGTDPLRGDAGLPASAMSPEPGAEPGMEPGTELGVEATASASDLDADHYPDAGELSVGLDPTIPDTDGDGVADGDEEPRYGTDPRTADSDGDGFSDGTELFATGTDPRRWDSDGDGRGDGAPPLP